MKTFFVSPVGNDKNVGTEREQAFYTLTRARDAVRLAKQSDEFDGACITVLSGKYSMAQGLHLDWQDSGAEEAPVIWKGEGKPIFSGAISIQGFQPVTDPEILARLPKDAAPFVVECDLFAQGVRDFGVFRSRGGGFTLPSHMEFFYKNQRQTLARWPNDGFTRVAGLVPGHINTYEEHGHEQQGSDTHFYFEEDRPLHWKHPEEVILHGYWSWDWADRYIKPVHWDMEKHIVEVESRVGTYDIRTNARFRYINVLEELDCPGEWYADRRSGKLYFWPPDAFEEGYAEVSMLEEAFLTLDHVSHVALEGLAFCSGRATAVEIQGGHHIALRDCHFYNLGSSGVNAVDTTETLLDSCSFANMGDGGITISGGDRKTLTPSGNRITNCDIHHFGEWSRCYCLGISLSGVGIRVDHNSIHDAPQEALHYHGNDHIIEYNDFYNLCQDADDSGATHTGRDWTQRGTVLRYNRVHGVQNLSNADRKVGIVGIYLDDWASGQIVYGNLFEDVFMGVMVGSGRDNLLKQNVFVNCHRAISFDARGLTWAQYYFDGRTNTLFDLLAEIAYEDTPYLQRYPQLASLLEDEPVLPKHNAFLENKVWGCETWIRFVDGMSEEILLLKDNEILPEAPSGWQQRTDLYPALTAGSTLDQNRKTI